ncbi:MAG: hypothetical protein ACI4U3_03370 [Traorella sp.]
MDLNILITGIGIFICISTAIETKKQRKAILELAHNQKCQEEAYYVKPMLMLALMFVVCVVSTIFSFKYEKESMQYLGLFLSFLFLSEIYRSYFMLRFYYNDKGIIIQERFVRIKSMKSMHKNSVLPISKWTLYLFNNEKLTIVWKMAKFIQEKFHVEVK